MFEILVIVAFLVAVLVASGRIKALEGRLVALEAFARSVTAQPPVIEAARAWPGVRTNPPERPAEEARDVPSRSTDDAGASFETPASPAPQDEAVRDVLPGSEGAEASGQPAPPPPLPPRAPARLPPAFPKAPPGAPPALGPPPLAKPRSFEEVLGARWAVWVGGVALALGGVFLVRYSIEQDLIGPAFRVTLGLLFAAVLLGAGEWLRRREDGLSLPGLEKANIPAILTAAGTSTAFATIYAAYGLYGLIGPATAFVALGLVSLLTMGAAMLHGPALAGLGLLAALASPALVETTDPSPVALVLYLAFATGSAYALSRLRLWRWLAIAAAAGGWLWGFALLVMGTAWIGGASVHVIVQLAFALLFLVIDPYRQIPEAEQRIDPLVAIVLFGLAVLGALTADVLEVGLRQQLFAFLIVAMLTGATFRVPAAASGLAAGAFAAFGTLLLWRVAGQAAAEATAIVRDLSVSPRPEAESAYLTLAFLCGGLVAAAGFGRVALGSRLRSGPAGWYVGAATLGPLAILVVTYWRITFFDRSVPFAVVAAAMGLGFAVVAGWFRRLDQGDSPALRLGLGAAAAASVAALSAGLTFAFDQGILTVALALSALGTAIVAEQARVPSLRYVVGTLGLAVAARLAYDPSVMRGAIGATPILNWLLWGYGVPALAFGLAARVLSREGRDWVVRFVEGLAILFAALLVFLEMRHALNHGDPFAPGTGHLEAGLVVTEALGFTLLMTRLDILRADPLYRGASLLFGALSLAGAFLALGIRFNPFISGEPILGGPLFSSLVPAYLLPAALGAAIVASSRTTRPRWFTLAAAGLALFLEVAFACLEVRHLFLGERIDLFRRTQDAELWCYSLVLIGNGIVLLAAGFWFDSRIARLTSALCIVAAILKVFLIDMSALEGLTRALSFVGLGLVLVAIGFAYQRLLGWRAARMG